VPAGTPLRCGAESTFECPAGHAELAGDGGSGLPGGKQNAGVGNLFAGQGAGPAADSATLCGRRRVPHEGPAFVQNLRRGHYEIAVDQPARTRLAAAFTQLARAI
jgi:hypothetical protein